MDDGNVVTKMYSLGAGEGFGRQAVQEGWIYIFTKFLIQFR